jgi:ankyrin repeat protein
LDGKTALIVAVERRNFPIVELLISNGACVNKIANTEISPLNSAMDFRTEDVGILRLLFEHGADIFEEDCHSDSILMNSVFRRDFELVKLFIEGVSYVPGDEGTRRGELSLAACCCVSQHEKAEMLLRQGVSPNNSAMSPLVFACCHSDEKMVEIVLEFGANVNIEDPKGGTPLSTAVSSNRSPELVRLLVEHGADVNYITTGFNDPLTSVTPLMEAARMRSLPLIRELLQLGADVNIQNNAKMSALHFCVGRTSYAPYVKSPLNFIHQAGPLYRTNSSSAEIVQALINCGVNVLAADAYGSTPLDMNFQGLREIFSSKLHYLCKDKQLLHLFFNVCKVLLKAGAGTREHSGDSFSLVLDAFLSCPDLAKMPSVELFPDLVEFAIISGVKLKFRQLSLANIDDAHVGPDHEAKLKLFKVVKNYSKNCLSLKQICRSVIRKTTLSTAFLKPSLCNIPLPQLLKEYVAFEYL